MSEIPNNAREERNRYYREWRARNKDKVKESQIKYWKKKAQENTEREDSNESDTHD